jgi:endonuclease/exonuclease/phosphatase family metal-dependent hydrolase
MGMRRSTPASVLFSTYNLLNLTEGSGPRYDSLVAVIQSLDCDVLAVQEVLAPDPEAAADLLRQLAADIGMQCEVPLGSGGRVAAVAFGGHAYHVGLMWRDGIEPVPDSLRRFGGNDFWHGLAVVTLDVGGTLVRHASFHASPFCRMRRADQNERLVAAITRSQGSSSPALIGGDWNGECADRVQDSDGTWRHYEPADPYVDVPWFADMIYQCEWDYDEAGVRRHWADRRAGDVLWSGGLRDAAAVLGARWQATTGHHPDDVYAQHGVQRRIDAVRVTAQLIPAMRGHQVLDSEPARAASDHLPVTVEYLPAALHP